MLAKYRYPGTRPYLEKDRNLFFGRERDIEKFSRLVVLEKLVVLIGRSGYGKTSLLNAGVIPRLIEKENYVVFPIALKEKTRGPLEEGTKEPTRNWSRKPLDLLLEHLKKRTNDKTFLTDKFNIAQELPKDSTALLWYYIKVIQIMYEGVDAITLVFDHFEDLFDSYPHEVDAFSEALATVLNLKAPKSVRNLLKQKINAAENKLTDDEIKQIFEPLNLKVVFSLRNDYLGELHRLKKFIPGVYSYTYELLPLNQRQALEALEKPASLEGDYSVTAFKFSQEALENVIKSFKDSPNKRIEAFQLQLIGERAEEIVSRRKKTGNGTSQLEISSKKLGSLDKIWQTHYKKIISEISPFHWERRKVKRFIENHLISSEGTRIPVDEVTASNKVSKEVLDALEKSLLIRPVLNSVSSTSYEISHDTLVSPILKSAEKRRKKELWGVIIILAILVAFLGSWLGYEKFIEKPPAEDSPPTDTIKPVIAVDTTIVTLYPLDFNIISFPCISDTVARVRITASNGVGGYSYEIQQPDGTILGPQDGNVFEGLRAGSYTIIVKDSVGTSKSRIFEVICDMDDDSQETEPDPLNTVDNLFSGKVNLADMELTASDESTRILYPDLPDPPICEPCIIRDELAKIKNWKFNKNENHLVGIGIPDSKINQETKEILLVLLFDQKAFWFNGTMPAKNAKFFDQKQIKYCLECLYYKEDSKWGLKLVGDYFLDSDKKKIRHKEDDEKERYKVFGELIREYKIKYVDDIYYSYLDGVVFDSIFTDNSIAKKYNYIHAVLQKEEQ